MEKIKLMGVAMGFGIIAMLAVMEVIVLISPWNNGVYVLSLMWIVGNIYLNKKIYEIEPYYSLRGLLWMKLFIAIIMVAFNVEIIRAVGNVVGSGFVGLKIFLAMPIIVLSVVLLLMIFFLVSLIRAVIELGIEKR